MLTKLPLPAVIGVFLLTATTALALTIKNTTTTITTTPKTTSTTTLNNVAAVVTSLEKVVAEVGRNRNGNGSRNRSRSRSTSVKDVPITMLQTKTKSAAQDVAQLEGGQHAAETTTSLLPLQPPLNVTSTTTSTLLTPPSGSTAGKHQLPISASTQKSATTQPSSTKYSSQFRAVKQSNVNAEKTNVVKSDSDIIHNGNSTKKVLRNISQLLPAPVVEVDVEKEPKKTDAASDQSSRKSPELNDYIHFDVTDEDGYVRGTATPTRVTRMDTVNEVLSNLFPNGFTDIFRFSYASEQPTPTNTALTDVSESPKQPTTAPPVETKLTAVTRSTTTTTTTTQKPRESRANAFFSYETSVSKEYRRELGPGHTEIVVEKLELLPRGASTSSGEFRDGSNLITKDDLMRINRAAVDSPVLPSLLIDPSEENTNATVDKPAARQGPIIILNDDNSADMEGISAEDNLIAESQNVGQRVYQRLPVGDKPYGYNVGVQRERMRPESEVNIRIAHEVVPYEETSINQRPIFVPEEQQTEQQITPDKGEASERATQVVLPSQQLDTFQEHAEQNFRQLNLVQEAPSRKFLRDFNPVLSPGADRSTPKGSFHYETHALQPSYYVQTAIAQSGEGEEQTTIQGGNRGANPKKLHPESPTIGAEHPQTQRLPLQQFDKDAAQLRYFKEQQYLQQQQQILQQKQQLLLQQQQQEQQRLQHESLIQQQQQLQQQQQQKLNDRGKDLFQPASQYNQQQQQRQQQKQLQQFHKELRQQQQPPVAQQYALFQQHPPLHEYKQPPEQQQKNQEQRQKEEHERARKGLQQQQQQELQLKMQGQQAEKQQLLKQQQQQQQHSTQQQPSEQDHHKALESGSKLHTQIRGDSEPASASLNHQAYSHPLQSPHLHSAPATPTPHSVVFVTLNTPTSQASRGHASQPAYAQKPPYDYVSKAADGANHYAPPTPAAKVKRPHGGYTFVEVQKSVNIHNKLITEKDGKLVEEHETIYPMPQYNTHQQPVVVAQPPAQPAYAPPPPVATLPPPQQPQPLAESPKPAAAQTNPTTEVPYTHYPLQYAHELSVLEEGVHPQDYYFVPKEYASLSANPINVQHIDEHEQQEEASSYTHLEHVLPLNDHIGHGHEHPQQYVQYIEQQVPAHPGEQTQHASPQPIEHIVHSAHQEAAQSAPIPHEEHSHPIPEKSTTKEVVEHQVEKIVERPVHIPYPVHVQQYIDRPYPVQEIVETHIPVPYPVPEPVAVPVHVDRYIDRPYPVEKIVEKRVPYPVEKVVERIVEKEIPIEVEKVVEKIVDRPVPIPIRVPVAIHVPYAQQPLPEYDDHAEIFGAPYQSHPNALGWPEQAALTGFGGRSPVSPQIPPKVLQNYYTRMLKKLLPKVLPQRGTSSSATTATTSTSYTHTQARPKAPSSSTSTSFKSTKQQKPVTPSGMTGSGKQISFKIGDMRFDLKPPPPPPTGPEWSKGSRYLYNTLPHDLSVADTSGAEQLAEEYAAPFAPHNEPYDEFQRWRNGHNLKRSPQFGRNLQMEYGFKPPLVPSVEINDQGIPLNTDAKEAE